MLVIIVRDFILLITEIEFICNVIALSFLISPGRVTSDEKNRAADSGGFTDIILTIQGQSFILGKRTLP